MQTDYQKLKTYYYEYYNECECVRYLLNNINNRPKLVIQYMQNYGHPMDLHFIARLAFGDYVEGKFGNYSHKNICNEYCNYEITTDYGVMYIFKEKRMIHLHQTVFRFYPHFLEYEATGKCEIYTNDFKYETNKFDMFDVDERLFNILYTFAYFDFLTLKHVETFIISINANDVKISKILVKTIVTFCKTTDIFAGGILIKSFFEEFIKYFRFMPPNYELFVGIPYYDFFLHGFLAKHMLMWICCVEQENYVDSLATRVIANDYLMRNVCNFLIGTETRN